MSVCKYENLVIFILVAIPLKSSGILPVSIGKSDFLLILAPQIYRYIDSKPLPD